MCIVHCPSNSNSWTGWWHTVLSPNSIMPTSRLSPKLPRGEIRGHESWNSATQITLTTFVICVLLRTLSSTFPVYCNGLNSIRMTQTDLSRTCHGLCCKHLDTSRWFVSATFTICVDNFPRGEVLVKVNIMEFGLLVESWTPEKKSESQAHSQNMQLQIAAKPLVLCCRPADANKEQFHPLSNYFSSCYYYHRHRLPVM